MGGHLETGSVQGSDRGLTPTRTVRVLPDVAGIDAVFDYSVSSDKKTPPGTIVRADLNGRRIRGWVLQDDVEPPEGVKLRPLTKISSAGPPSELIDLAEWAAWRWSGRRAHFLQTASPDQVVPVERLRRTSRWTSSPPDWCARPATLLRLPPATDPFDTLLSAHRFGPCLILTPSQRSALRIAKALSKAGGGGPVVTHPEGWALATSGSATVVGTRGAAWAPGDFAGFVVLDAHDESFRSEAAPTWNAVEVVAERAARRQVPALYVSYAPRAEQLHAFHLQTVDRQAERGGWAPLHVVDMREEDPRAGLYSKSVVKDLRADGRVVCVLNRKGRAQLLLCHNCQKPATCSLCGASMEEVPHAQRCRRCAHVTPGVCRECGSQKFKRLRMGVTRVREELETLAGRPVGEVTADTKELPAASILVGTEAVLHRVGRADRVVFLEFDQELLAGRVRAAEDALILLGRASRIVGGHGRNGVVSVQTRLPGHEVIEAALSAQPDVVGQLELQRREEIGWPPFSALARVSGEGAADFVTKLPASVSVLGPDDDNRYLVRGESPATLADALGASPRPTRKKLRVEVDPARL